MEKVEISLSDSTSEDEVISILGEILEFGGSEGNIPVEGVLQGRGWGLNWNAVNDSLMFLQTGGIWGTSKKFDFPLLPVFKNWTAFKVGSPSGYEILVDILFTAKQYYAKDGMIFDYKFE